MSKVVFPEIPRDSEIGRFTYDVHSDRWVWDDTVYSIHGYRPGEVEPTTELFLRHKHAGDRTRVEAAIQTALRTGEPFTVAYRLRPRHAEDELRHVVLVGEGVFDDPEAQQAGRVSGLEGYYIDLSAEFGAEGRVMADAAVAASAAGREAIEQAKGVLMVSYGLDPDAAFAMLRWWSRNRNIKVRTLAERLVAIASAGVGTHPALRSLLDSAIDDLASDPVEQDESTSSALASVDE